MPAVTCRKCGAVVSVRSSPDNELEIGYGSSFRESCKLLRGAASMENIGGVGECDEMREAIQRAHFRIARSPETDRGTC